MIDKRAKPTKLLWVDLEMTGLDSSHDVILEVAALITDFDFNRLASYEAVIAQPEAVLTTMNEWSQVQHTESGLITKIRQAGRPEADVQAELAQLITQQFAGEPAVLAGNSIHQDRKFIAQWWPQVEQLLHYRMLDVSAWKLVMESKYNLEFTKKETHRALGDIEESIAELQYYLKWLQTER